MGAAPRDTSIIIANKATMKAIKDSVINQVMDDPVPKISGPNFTDLGAGDDKGNAAANQITAVRQIVIKINQILFKIRFKFELIDRVAFRSPTIEISIKDRINREMAVSMVSPKWRFGFSPVGRDKF